MKIKKYSSFSQKVNEEIFGIFKKKDKEPLSMEIKPVEDATPEDESLDSTPEEIKDYFYDYIDSGDKFKFGNTNKYLCMLIDCSEIAEEEFKETIGRINSSSDIQVDYTIVKSDDRNSKENKYLVLDNRLIKYLTNKYFRCSAEQFKKDKRFVFKKYDKTILIFKNLYEKNIVASDVFVNELAADPEISFIWKLIGSVDPNNIPMMFNPNDHNKKDGILTGIIKLCINKKFGIQVSQLMDLTQRFDIHIQDTSRTYTRLYKK